VLYEKISSFIMQTRRFMNPHLMTTLRSFIIKNQNLALVFDTLALHTLFSYDPREFKEKADIVEAMIGEMAEVACK
jgi:dsRNA-specific ribonuclease